MFEKSQFPHVKILVSVTEFDPKLKLFNSMIFNHASRERFKNSIIEFILKNGFDGLGK